MPTARPPTERERTPRQAKAEAELRDIAEQLRRAWEAPSRPPPPGTASSTILPDMLRQLTRAQGAVAAVLAENNAEIQRLRQAEQQAPAHSAQAEDARRASYVLQLMTPGIKAWQKELKDRGKCTLLDGLHETLRDTQPETGAGRPGRRPATIKQIKRLSARLDWSHPATLLHLEFARAKVAPRDRAWRVAYRAAAKAAQKETDPQARAAA